MGYKEVSLTQFFDMYQKAYSGSFTQFDSTFCDGGYANDPSDIELVNQFQAVTNIFLRGDETCSEKAN